MTRRFTLSLFVLPAVLLPPVSAATQPTLIAKSVTIYRDNYGVPHVFGPTDASCIFGYIYAQAEDNFWQIEDSYIRALGRASEVYGSKTLDDDRLVRALQIPKLAQEEYDRASPETKKLVDASAEGLNYFLARNLQVKPRLITHFEPWYIYAFNRYALYYKFIFGKSGLRSHPRSRASRNRKAPTCGPSRRPRAPTAMPCFSSIRTSPSSASGNGTKDTSTATKDGT